MNTSTHFDPFEIIQTTIESVPVYYKPTPWASCIFIDIVFPTGAFSDPLGKEGLSHFLEHMIFDGAPSVPNRKAVNEWRKQYTLGTWNANTSHYRTAYHLKTLPEHFEEVLRGMFDQIYSPFLRDEDVEHERRVITQEAWRRYRNEKFLQYQKEYAQKVYPGHTLSRITSPLGWPETIPHISAEDIRQWHQTHYHAGNMFIVLSGLVDRSHLNILSSFLAQVPRKTSSPYISEPFPLPTINEITKRSNEIGIEQEQAQVNMSVERPEPDFPHQHERLFGNLVADILHEKLRDEQALCYSVDVSINRSFDYGSFGISVKTSEDHIDVVKETIRTEMQKILTTDTYTNLFLQLQKLAIDRLQSVEYNTWDILEHITEHMILHGQVETRAQDIALRKQTTFEDMQKAGHYWTDPSYTVTEIILPTRK